jgi:hypothetical protein
MITQEKLNQRAIEAFTQLAAMLPSYIAGISHKQSKSGVSIALQNPSQHDHPLTIFTDNEEITIMFGETHSHISDYGNDKREEDLIEDAVIAIVRLVTGIDETYSAWTDDRCLGGGMIYPNAKDEDIGSMFRKATRIRVTGWGVNQNREISR